MASADVRRQQQPPVSITSNRPALLTAGAFAVLVVLVAVNPLAVSYTDRTLAPFWGAGTRIAGASLLFLAYVAFRRVPLPRGVTGSECSTTVSCSSGSDLGSATGHS